VGVSEYCECDAGFASAPRPTTVVVNADKWNSTAWYSARNTDGVSFGCRTCAPEFYSKSQLRTTLSSLLGISHAPDFA
jgi:hypothetical protein